MAFGNNLRGDRTDKPQNPELVSAMQAVAHDDNPNTRRRLYEAYLRSWLIVPTVSTGPSQPEIRTTTEDENVTVITQEGPDGKPVLAVFTDTGALLQWEPKGCGYMAMEGAAFFRFARDNGLDSILVNPAGPTGGHITRAEIAVLAQGVVPEGFGQGSASVPWAYGEGTQVLIAAPAEKPSEELVAVLRSSMERYPQIAEAYVALTSWGGDRPHLTVALSLSESLDEQAVRSMMQDLSSHARPALGEDKHLSFMVLGDDGVSKAIRELQLLIHRRETDNG